MDVMYVGLGQSFTQGEGPETRISMLETETSIYENDVTFFDRV